MPIPRPSKSQGFQQSAFFRQGLSTLTVPVPDGVRCISYNLPWHDVYSWDAISPTEPSPQPTTRVAPVRLVAPTRTPLRCGDTETRRSVCRQSADRGLPPAAARHHCLLSAHPDADVLGLQELVQTVEPPVRPKPLCL